MAHDEILKRGASFRERGTAFRALSNTVKAWLMAYHQCVAVAGSQEDHELNDCADQTHLYPKIAGRNSS
jgi:hypothetical protein